MSIGRLQSTDRCREGRDFVVHARIGVMRALNQHVERVFDPNRKDSHSERRKLVRDR